MKYSVVASISFLACTVNAAGLANAQTLSLERVQKAFIQGFGLPALNKVQDLAALNSQKIKLHKEIVATVDPILADPNLSIIAKSQALADIRNQLNLVHNRPFAKFPDDLLPGSKNFEAAIKRMEGGPRGSMCDPRTCDPAPAVSVLSKRKDLSSFTEQNNDDDAKRRKHDEEIEKKKKEAEKQPLPPAVKDPIIRDYDQFKELCHADKDMC